MAWSPDLTAEELATLEKLGVGSILDEETAWLLSRLLQEMRRARACKEARDLKAWPTDEENERFRRNKKLAEQLADKVLGPPPPPAWSLRSVMPRIACGICGKVGEHMTLCPMR